MCVLLPQRRIFIGLALVIVMVSAGVSAGQDRVDYEQAIHHAGIYTNDNSRYVDFELIGSVAYLVDGYGGMEIVDFSAPDQPQLLGAVGDFNGVFIEISGQYAYISADEGLIIIDISDSATPQLVGQVEIPNAGHPIEKSGNSIYTMAIGGLGRVDVTDPGSPTDAGLWAIGDGIYSPLAAEGDILFVANEEDFFITDTSAPENSRVVGSYQFGSAGIPVELYNLKILVEDELVFVPNLGLWETNEMFRILDISDPSQIESIGQWFAPDEMHPSHRQQTAITYADGFLYCTNILQGLYVIDVSNPFAPGLASHLPLEYPQSDLRYSCHASADMLYTICYGRIRFTRIPTPSIVWDLGKIDMGEYVYCLDDAPLNNNTCLVGTESSFRIVDHSQVNSPVTVGSLDLAVRDISSVNNLAYLAAGSDGLVAVDVSVPANPTIVGTLDTFTQNVALLDNYAYVKGENQLSVVDITDVGQMSIVGQCPYSMLPPAEASSTKQAGGSRINTTHTGSIVVSGNIVLLTETYESWGEDAFWFNVEDPQNPQLLNSSYYETDDFYVSGLSSDLNENIIISTSAGYRAARDVSDPTNPVSYPVMQRGGYFTRSGNLLYMINNSGDWNALGFPSVQLIDVSNLESLPVIGAGYIMATTMEYENLIEGSIAVSGDHVVASWGHELFFLPRHSADVVPVFLSTFSVVANQGSVNISWATQGASNDDEFKLIGRQIGAVAGANWEVPYSQEIGNSYVAHDTQAELTAAGYFEYSLYYKEKSGNWAMLDSRTIELETPGLTCYLDQVHPNPFNPQTNISFYVGQRQQVSIDVFDLAGRRLADLSDQIYTAGRHTVSWNGKDVGGRDVSSGTYMVRMKTDGSLDTRKITLVR